MVEAFALDEADILEKAPQGGKARGSTRPGSTRDDMMPIRSRRFWLTAGAVMVAGYLLGWATQAAILASLPQPESCWRPGMARNIGIAELACP
jgi:hypothetical protein